MYLIDEGRSLEGYRGYLRSLLNWFVEDDVRDDVAIKVGVKCAQCNASKKVGDEYD